VPGRVVATSRRELALQRDDRETLPSVSWRSRAIRARSSVDGHPGQLVARLDQARFVRRTAIAL
jgi:hypothetical protein